MANKLTQAQERKLERQKQEIDNRKEIVKGLKEARDVGIELTDIQKNILETATRENIIRQSTSSLETKLTKQAMKTNKVQSELGKQAKVQLDITKKAFNRKNSKMTEESFQSQVSLIEQIAAGSATIEEIQTAIADLPKDAAKGMKEFLETSKQSLETQQFTKDSLSETDNIIGGLGSKIKGFLTNPLTAAVALLLTFNATQESIGKQFGAIGVTEFREDLAGANVQFTQLGLSASEAQSTISNLANEFGISVTESSELSKNISRLAVSTGASLDDTTKLIGVFTQTQNLTGEQAANLLASTTALANANNVAPDKILGDVAQNTEFFAQFADEGGENILRAAVQARKLGINLQSVEKITSGLLDFQSSLNAENEASVLIGRRLNFQKARELALSNDVEGATRAVVEQLGSAEEFNRLNAIQRKALADAAGVEVSELAKIVNKEKEALTLAGALSKQQIQPIPEEVLTQTAQLIGSLQSIGITLAEVLGPPLNMIVGVFGFLAEGLGAITGLIYDNALAFTVLATGIVGIMALTKQKIIMDKKAALTNLAKKAFEGGIKGPVGITLGIAAALAGAAAINRIVSMDDGHMNPDGTFISSTKGTVLLNEKDSAVFGTNLFGGGGEGGQASNVEQIRAIEKQTETQNRTLAILEGAFGDGGRGLAKMLAGGVVTGIDS